ncbi:hypothetical protein NFF84_00545 [Proteus mirabilis]|uniref:Phage protein n=1 Tax=Proteus vulgaris TaxID=585 RepID=A0A379FDB5_PROVU|nr:MULTISPECIES: hypothetical protein [Proteus]MCT0257029.1 hypothetical protein [Proteus mirabilis]MDF7135372.1 hypothetical protein [Proteus mirabilis]MDF7246681.1 hypothetical protein [Proteus mirabilis]MDF7400159.1 hypothetical protein [Proteus mirabilis]MDF7405790.1 hypothetical protein [Proteus mirabilis]
MTVVEGFSIFGSLASAVAIIVSLIVFWVQRTNEKSTIERNTQNELKALKTLIYNEVRNNCIYLKQMMQFFDAIKNGEVTSCRKVASLEAFYFEYTKVDDSKTFILGKTQSSKVIDTYLLDVSRIDEHLIDSLIDLKFLIEGYNEVTLVGLRLYLDTNPDKEALMKFLSGGGYTPYKYKELCNHVLKICNPKNDFKPYQI